MSDLKVRKTICEVPEWFEQIEYIANMENRSFSNMVAQLCHEAIMAREFSAVGSSDKVVKDNSKPQDNYIPFHGVYQKHEEMVSTMTENGVDESLARETSREINHEQLKWILPAWFGGRFNNDVWYFGLLLTTGQVLGVESLNDVTVDITGQMWLDVTLLSSEQVKGMKCGNSTVFGAPTSRMTASINASTVVAAFELADT